MPSGTIMASASNERTSASSGVLRHALSNVTVETTVERVIYIRSLNGIGDSLNGLASAYLLSQFLGASFTVCWPEAKHAPWLVPLQTDARCTFPKRAWERHIRSRLDTAVGNGRKRAARDSAWQQILEWDTGAFVQCGSNLGDFYAMYSSGNWSALRRKSRLFLSSHRGFLTIAWLSQKTRPPFANWLRSLLSTADGERSRRKEPFYTWLAMRLALRRVLRVAKPEPASCCVHYRHAVMQAVRLQNVLACASRPDDKRDLSSGGPSCTQVRVFSDLHTAHLAIDEHLGEANHALKLLGSDRGRVRASNESLAWALAHGYSPVGYNWSIGLTEDTALSHVREDAADWQAWLGLTSCRRLFISRSAFAATAAVASSATEVYVAARRTPRPFDPPTREACDSAFEPMLPQKGGIFQGVLP